MSQVIKIKHSITPTNVPVSLETGELAINVTDGSLFFGSATTVYNSFKFNGVTVTGTGVFSGTTTHAGDASFVDNAKAIFGDADDLKIYHSGTHSIIQDAGIGHLRIKSSKVMIEGSASGDAFAIFTDGGGVELYYDNVKKFETTTDGATMSGAIAMGTNKITGLGDPTLAQDGATKAYVDSQTHTDGTVTSVAALTLGTTGTDLSSTVVDGTTTPVITLNVPTSSASNRGALSSTDWTTFNNKTTNTGTVTSVAISGSDGIDIDSGSPITSSGTIALGLSNVPNSALANSSINVVAGDGLTGGGAALLGSDVTIDVGGGTGLRLGASGIEIMYTSTSNFIDAATNLEGTAIAIGDSIVYHDADDDNVKKGFISDLPFTSSLGTVTSVAISGSDGIDIDSGSPITSSGTIALGLSNVPNSSLANSTVSYGGISLSLGGTDATPAFNLSDATAYPGTSTLITTGTITTGVWNSSRLFTKQVDATSTQGDYVNFGTETITTVGLIYYYDNGNWALANAAVVATGTFLLAVAMGTNSLTDGMLIRGMVGELSYDAGDDGDVLYLSTTNGRLTTTAPTASGNVVRVLGYALGDTPVLWFNPDNTWVELT